MTAAQPRPLHIAIALLAATATAAADPAPAHDTKAPFVEVNLVTYVLHGWSGFAGYGYHHLQFGAGAYGFKLPAFIRDSAFTGAGGLDVHNTIGVVAFGRYFLNEHETGFYGALQLGWGRFGFAMDGVAGTAHAEETYVDPYVGYVWKPMRNGFYVNPSLGVALSKSYGTFAIHGQRYEFRGFVPLVFLQVGYAFE